MISDRSDGSRAGPLCRPGNTARSPKQGAAGFHRVPILWGKERGHRASGDWSTVSRNPWRAGSHQQLARREGHTESSGQKRSYRRPLVLHSFTLTGHTPRVCDRSSSTAVFKTFAPVTTCRRPLKEQCVSGVLCTSLAAVEHLHALINVVSNAPKSCETLFLRSLNCRRILEAPVDAVDSTREHRAVVASVVTDGD
jgi:hypothetical protein